MALQINPKQIESFSPMMSLFLFLSSNFEVVFTYWKKTFSLPLFDEVKSFHALVSIKVKIDFEDHQELIWAKAICVYGIGTTIFLYYNNFDKFLLISFFATYSSLAKCIVNHKFSWSFLCMLSRRKFYLFLWLFLHVRWGNPKGMHANNKFTGRKATNI
jgi:hypothetical protein